jgi:hypothetical protein
LLRVNKDAQAVRVRRYAHWPLPSFYAVQGRRAGYEELMRYFAARLGENHRIDEQGYELMGPEVVQRRSDLPPEPVEEQSTTSQSLNQGFNSNPNLNWQSERPNTGRRWTGGPPR